MTQILTNTLRPATLASVLVTAVLSGCAVGPDYQAPTQVAEVAVSSDYQMHANSLAWWQAFDDVQLQQLIQRALQENRQLRSAQANVARAYAAFREQDSEQLPSAELSSGYQVSKNDTLSVADDDVISRGYRNGVGLSWDLDLFGHLQRATEAAQANAERAEFLWREAQLSLIAQVAKSYGDYRGAQLRLEVAEQNLTNLAKSEDIISARAEVGRASDLELAQVDAQQHQVKAQAAFYQAQLASAKATLAALLATTAEQLEITGDAVLPELSEPLVLNNDINYLRYRPDVASAERQLAAATAGVGVATADWYPQLSVTGFLGYLSGPGMTLSSATESWSLAPTLSWQLGDYPSLKARLQAAEASQSGALANFEQTIFDALAEMQLSLERYQLSRQQRLQTEMQWQANSKAMYIAQARYEAGSGEFLSLLDSERELLATRNQLAQLEQQTFSRLVDIYQSFAGAIAVP